MHTRHVAAALALLATAMASAADSSSSLRGSNDYHRTRFQSWIKEYAMEEEIDADSFESRLEIFIRNSDMIESHNAKNFTYTLGHNSFSHLSFDEFKKLYLGYLPQREVTFDQPEASQITRVLSSVTYSPIDWVAAGAVTSVKDQGQCGSCFTFSATGAIEGAYEIATGNLVDLSMQEVVDCDKKDNACQGGDMRNVFDWVKSQGGLCKLADYPYESGDSKEAGQCASTSCEPVDGTAPSSWKQVTATKSGFYSALKKQPLAVAVAASKQWQFYKSGVLPAGDCDPQLNHGILAVGYDEDETTGEGYWIVKNSWSSKWGMNGYIHLSADNEENACGILTDASYPIISSSSSSSSSSSMSFVSSTSKGSGSATDCGGGTVVFNTLDVEPKDIQKNQKVSLSASGVLNKPTTSGTYELNVFLAGSSIFSTKGNACGDSDVTLPLGAGTVSLHGFACPANPGPVTYGMDVVLPSIAPSGDYDIKLTAKDQDGESLLCVDTKLSF